MYNVTKNNQTVFAGSQEEIEAFFKSIPGKKVWFSSPVPVFSIGQDYYSVSGVSS